MPVTTTLGEGVEGGRGEVRGEGKAGARWGAKNAGQEEEGALEGESWGFVPLGVIESVTADDPRVETGGGDGSCCRMGRAGRASW